jgi:hypothetical protein
VPLLVLALHQLNCRTTDSLAAANEGEMFSNGRCIDFHNKLPDMI